MANLIEMLGLRDITIQDQQEEYVKLWELLRRVKEGEVSIHDVRLSITPAGVRQWEIVPASEKNQLTVGSNTRNRVSEAELGPLESDEAPEEEAGPDHQSDE